MLVLVAVGGVVAAAVAIGAALAAAAAALACVVDGPLRSGVVAGVADIVVVVSVLSSWFCKKELVYSYFAPLPPGYLRRLPLLLLF